MIRIRCQWSRSDGEAACHLHLILVMVKPDKQGKHIATNFSFLLTTTLTISDSEISYCREVRDEPFPWSLDIGKARARRIDAAELLHVPVILRTDRIGQRFYDCGLPDHLKGEQIPYWYAFWETPHTSGYGPDEFRKVNSMLFPEGTDDLEIFEWTTDWSNYFEAGHEWWGAACWSVYDKNMSRYVVIMASATD